MARYRSTCRYRWSLLPAAFVLLAACGGDSGGGGDGGGSAAPPANAPPVASFTASQTYPLRVLFVGDSSTDPDGSITSYRWDFGDGNTSDVSAHLDHVYQNPGTYTATLTVTDNLGATGTSSVSVVVRNIQAYLITPGESVPGDARRFVADRFAVGVEVSSIFEASAVTATLLGRETPLEFSANGVGCGGSRVCFAGEMSLEGEAPGAFTLEIRAADVRGNVDVLSVQVIHDNPPQLTVAQPLDRSVALPTVPMDARCNDDLPGCIVQLTVYESSGACHQCSVQHQGQSAPSSLLGTLDFSNLIHRTLTLRFLALDSVNQGTSMTLTVFVEDDARLTVAAEVPGAVVDADEHRLLVIETTPTGDAVSIYDRDTGITEQIATHLAVDDRAAFLTPSGAIFLEEIDDPDFPSHSEPVRLWRAGSLTEVGQHDTGFVAVRGRYAIWHNRPNLYRLDTTTGALTLVASDARSPGSVAEDGTVVYSNSASQIIRDVSGQKTTLTSDDGLAHIDPVTDGANVVYTRVRDLFVGEIILMQNGMHIPLGSRDPDVRFPPDLAYQAEDGWAAYTDLGTQQQSHVFTRSPQGTVVRHTDFANDSTIDRLAGNGEVMLINGQVRYFSRGTGAVAVSSSEAESFWLGGSWFVAIGRAFLAVDTQ